MKMAVQKTHSRAIFETSDKQLIPLDDIQHINARIKENQARGYETFTILYKGGMKVEIPMSEYDNLYKCWEARKNGNNK